MPAAQEQQLDRKGHISSRRALKRRTTKRPGRAWRLNWPLLLGTVLFAAVVAPAAGYWHAAQVRRNKTSSLLVRATELEANQQWLPAASAIHRYLKLFPHDAAARIRRAKDFDKAAVSLSQKRRAIELYALAQDLAPADLDLRRRLIELMLETGAERAALEKANQLLHDDPQDAVALRAKALALEEKSRRSGVPPLYLVSETFVEAIEQNPADADLALRLARIYRDGAPSLADAAAVERAAAAMDALVARQSSSPAAWLARHRYRKEYDLPGAEGDLAKARELDPKLATQ